MVKPSNIDAPIIQNKMGHDYTLPKNKPGMTGLFLASQEKLREPTLFQAQRGEDGWKESLNVHDHSV